MPFSSRVQRSATWDEKQMAPPAMSIPLPNCRRSLSLAVMAMTFAPATENFSKMVLERISAGSVITTSRPVSVSR